MLSVISLSSLSLSLLSYYFACPLQRLRRTHRFGTNTMYLPALLPLARSLIIGVRTWIEPNVKDFLSAPRPAYQRTVPLLIFLATLSRVL
jgi:hypothetical protein